MSDSIITKKAIAQALKEAAAQKGFDKTSIADITERCGLNRQTFYYHFQDKYELLGWIYYNEAFAGVVEGISFENWDERLLLLFRLMLREKSFYTSTIKSAGEIFEQYLHSITHALFYGAAEKLDENSRLTEEDKQFFAEFYTYAICGVVAAWAKGGMRTPPQELAHRLKQLASNSEKLAYLRYLGVEQT